MRPQQAEVEIAAQEDPLWEEAPVDGPPKEELASQVEGAADVAHRVRKEERQAEQQLRGTKATLSPGSSSLLTLRHRVIVCKLPEPRRVCYCIFVST